MRKKTTERQRRSIPVLLINGDRELGEAIGITSSETLARYRKEGMPYYANGNSFLYDPKEVVDWIKKRFKIQRVNQSLL